jgi:hypothetical protein
LLIGGGRAKQRGQSPLIAALKSTKISTLPLKTIYNHLLPYRFLLFILGEQTYFLGAKKKPDYQQNNYNQHLENGDNASKRQRKK